MAESQKKVLFIGLDNAGKTSFIKALDRKRVTEMKPTPGIDLSYADVLGYKLSRLDLGGQLYYRESYFQDEAKVFAHVDLVFFLIDVLEEDERMEEALKYYEEVLEVYKLIGEKPPFIICIHKSDPDVFFEHKEDIKEINERVKNISDQFQNISEGFKVQIVKTSIFDRESLIRAFTTGIKAFLTKFDVLDLHLTEFCNDAELDKVVLYEKNSLILGESRSTKPILNPLESVMMDLIMIFDDLSKKKDTVEKLEIVGDGTHGFVIFSTKIKNFDFYIGLLGDVQLNFPLIIELFENKYSKKMAATVKEIMSE